MITVRFEPSGLRCHCPGDATLLEAAQKAGVSLPAVCGGAGTCGKCRVSVQGKVSAPTAVERRFLSENALGQGVRLACQTRPRGDVVVTVDSGRDGGPILTRGITRTVERQPAVEKRYLRLPAPTLEGNPADREDLMAAAGGDLPWQNEDLGLLRELPGRLREWGYAGTLVAVEGRIVDFEKGDTTGQAYGLAIDLGTTTIVVKLVDLRSGTVEAVASSVNPQRVYGEDVISRIQYAGQSRSHRRRLQSLVAKAINGLIDEVLGEAKIRRNRIYEAVIVGNTAMLHLLIGVDARFLAQYPYVPAFRAALRLDARELGLRIHPRGRVYLLPAIGRFVGGDTTGVILATDLLRRESLTLAIDIGTNGEIVLGRRGWGIACSTAAGPAFEGATIVHGMRAEKGAIDALWLDNGELKFHVIGEVQPRGICGSACIDLVAVLLSVGAIEPSGRMLPPEDLPPDVPANLRERVRRGERGVEFVLAEVEGRTITFTSSDVRQVQLAKGAIATGMQLLLRRAGVGIADVDQILVAGGFGNYIRPENAIRIGLLPPVDPGKIRFVGNAALTGAEMALLSRKAREEASSAAAQVEYVEIAAEPEFQDLFAENMFFPSRDLALGIWKPSNRRTGPLEEWEE